MAAPGISRCVWQKQARECRAGISQAACGIYQTAANASVIQPRWSLNGGVSERISGDQKCEECRNVSGITCRGIQEARDVMHENVWVKTYWLSLVSQSNQSYVSHPTQAVSLIIIGRRNKAATPTGTAHLIENTTLSPLCSGHYMVHMVYDHWKEDPTRCVFVLFVDYFLPDEIYEMKYVASSPSPQPL